MEKSLDKVKREFEESIKKAREYGVPEDKILKSKEEIDNFFMPNKTKGED